MNDEYIIPSLNSYNQVAKDANMKQYEMTDNLSFIQINAEMSKIWPVISSRKEPLPDADSFNGKPNKRGLIEK